MARAVYNENTGEWETPETDTPAGIDPVDPGGPRQYTQNDREWTPPNGDWEYIEGVGWRPKANTPTGDAGNQAPTRPPKPQDPGDGRVYVWMGDQWGLTQPQNAPFGGGGGGQTPPPQPGQQQNFGDIYGSYNNPLKPPSGPFTFNLPPAPTFTPPTWTPPSPFTAPTFTPPDPYTAPTFTPPGAFDAPTFTAPDPFVAPAFTPPSDFEAPTFTAPTYTAPAAFQAPTGDQIRNEPGYDFRLAEGQKALERSNAAKGLGRTGGSYKGLLDYGQNFASHEYNNVYNRQFGQYQDNVNQQVDAFDRQYRGAQDTFDSQYRAAREMYDTKYGSALEAHSRQYQGAKDTYDTGYTAALDAFNAKYKGARDTWDTGYTTAMDLYNTKFQGSKAEYDTGYQSALDQFNATYKGKRDEYDTGYTSSLDRFDREYTGARDKFAPTLEDWRLRGTTDQRTAELNWNRKWDEYTFGSDDNFRRTKAFQDFLRWQAEFGYD